MAVLDTESRNRTECTAGNVDSNSLEQPPKKASAHIDSKTLERSECVSVERDSKVRETGNVAEDYLDLDGETVQRSDSTGDLVDLEQPPKESKVSKNIDSDNVERSEAIVGSRSNVGEQLNVEAGDLDRIDEIDSENVESSRSSIVESISQELPRNQWKLIDYTDSESDLSDEGTGGSVFRKTNISACGPGVQRPTSGLQTLNTDVNEIVIAGGPSYVRGQTLYLEGDDVHSESFNRSDSTFGIIDTSSQVAIAPEVSNVSLGSRCFPASEVSTASRRQITQEQNEVSISLPDTEVSTASRSEISQEGTSSTEVRHISEREISVSSLQTTSTSLQDTEVSTASRSEISQEGTSSTEVRHISEREISVSSLQTTSTSLQDTEVSTASRSEISQEVTVTETSSTEVRHISERELSVSSLKTTSNSLQDTEVSAISHQSTQVRTIREIERSVTVQTSSTEVINTSERHFSVSVAQSRSAEVRNVRETEHSVSSVLSNSTRVLIREREFSVSLVQASSTEEITIDECEMGRTSVEASTSQVHNSSEIGIEIEMQSTSNKLANRTERAISPTVDQYNSANVDQVIASVSLPVRDRNWPNSNFKFTKDKGEGKGYRRKWIYSSVDSDSELETLCSLGPKFAVGIDARFYLAEETTYLPEVKCANDPSYPSLAVVLSIVPPVELFHAKKEQYEKIYRATIQVEIEYTEELFEIDTSGIPIEQALETREIQAKFHFKYDVTGVRVAKRKHQQTMDRYLLKPYEWKRKVNITFAHAPITAYKGSHISLACKLSVSRNQPIRRPAIGRISRGVKRPFSGDHSDRISKRSCHYSGKLVTPDGEANDIRFANRTASSNKYLYKLMTREFRQEMEKVQIQLKTAKEKLILEKKQARIERMKYLKRLFTFPSKGQPICTKDKERDAPIDIFKPNKKLWVGDDEMYKKRVHLARRRRAKLLADRLAALKRRALKRNLDRIRQMKRNYYDAAVSYTRYTSCLFWTSDTETEDNDSDDCYIDYDQYAVEKIFPPELVHVENMSPQTHPDDDKIAVLSYLKIYNRTVLPAPAYSSFYISKPVFDEVDTE